MKPFNKDSVCIKCGYPGASTEWYANRGIEMLLRKCYECGYNWNELTIDASGEISKPETGKRGE